ncbi:hypothetical protein ACL02S_19405 [Nocardia sp. 004]|uniref:hypothetical protein n=1 Tax=Nocardia sp. 004 TaxID=3385978 RepID=UPI0039A3D35D
MSDPVHNDTRTDPSKQDRSAGFPDRARTTRSHAGEAIRDGYNIPGLILIGLGVLAIGGALTAAGYGFAGWAVVATVAALVCGIAGVVWVLLEHRRVKHREGLALRDQQGH